MNDPTSRVLALLELLQANPRTTGADLAARLGVDPRTVRRYAARLQDLGIPVEAERGRYGGYRLGPGYKLPPLIDAHRRGGHCGRGRPDGQPSEQGH